ncbi:MAG TPA: response regulator [Pyrinomonadaceae bacterium]|jgi:DNA-binding response OmpR family regulator|nr:response regulator [Pyrinomonadaceae bacterium]
MPERKRRILCAESNKDVGDLIALMLGQKGYEVETVRTAADCVKLASTDRFDLYILNDTYIDADSLELCRRLRELDPVTPVLLFSLESSGPPQRRDPVRAGIRIYKSKTSDFVSLVQTIDQLLRS